MSAAQSNCSVKLGKRVPYTSPVKVNTTGEIVGNESSGVEKKMEKVENVNSGVANEDFVRSSDERKKNSTDDEDLEGLYDDENEDTDGGVYISDSDVCEKLSAIKDLEEMDLNDEDFNAGLAAIEDSFQKKKAAKKLMEDLKKKRIERDAEATSNISVADTSKMVHGEGEYTDDSEAERRRQVEASEKKLVTLKKC